MCYRTFAFADELFERLRWRAKGSTNCVIATLGDFLFCKFVIVVHGGNLWHNRAGHASSAATSEF
jgi:hypothetical protein